MHPILTSTIPFTVDHLSYKTIHLNRATANKSWVVLDASAQTLGRFCSSVAYYLRGKHKTGFTPNSDCGDYVIVINSGKIKLTGKKFTDKVYTRHTGFPGGQRFSTPREEFAKTPNRVIEHAVRGMLPKNRLGRELFRNLHVFEDANHPHEAQQPVLLEKAK